MPLLILYVVAAGCVYLGAVGGLYDPKEVVGLSSQAMSVAVLLDVPLRSNNTGLILFGLFSFIAVPTLAFGFAQVWVRPLRAVVAVGVWMMTGLVTYGFAHLVD